MLKNALVILILRCTHSTQVGR